MSSTPASWLVEHLNTCDWGRAPLRDGDDQAVAELDESVIDLTAVPLVDDDPDAFDAYADEEAVDDDDLEVAGEHELEDDADHFDPLEKADDELQVDEEPVEEVAAVEKLLSPPRPGEYVPPWVPPSTPPRHLPVVQGGPPPDVAEWPTPTEPPPMPEPPPPPMLTVVDEPVDSDGFSTDGGYDGTTDHVATTVDGVAGVELRGAEELDERDPVIPVWARSTATIQERFTRKANQMAYVFAFHVLRLPLYYARIAKEAPKGLWQGIVAFMRFTIDKNGTHRIDALAYTDTASGNVTLSEKNHLTTVRNHLIVDVITLLAVIAFYFFAGSFVPDVLRPFWLYFNFFGVLVPVLGFVGRPEGAKPLIERVIYKGAVVEPINQEMVIRALAAALPPVQKAIDKGGKGVEMRTPPTLLSGQAGYRFVIELPHGATVEALGKNMARFAAGLRRDASCIAITQVAAERGGHPGLIDVVALDLPMRTRPPVEWTYSVKPRPVDLFEPLPVATDMLGKTVAISLMFRAGIVGAIPRVGKTFLLRLMALAAALDVRAELHLWDLKGGADFLKIGGVDIGEGVCHAFGEGNDEEVIRALEADLEEVWADVGRRRKVIRHLVATDEARCPEGQVTTELASDPALGLHPVVIIVDETQYASERAMEILSNIVRTGPAFGVCAYLATQHVTSDTIPRTVSSSASLRVSLAVQDHGANDQILGTGAYSKGYRASDLGLDDKGIGYLGGEGRDTQFVKFDLADGPDAARIAGYARTLRQRAGRLTGRAAGDEPEVEERRNPLEDLLEVWPKAENGQAVDGVWTEELLPLMASAHPDTYPADLGVKAFNETLRKAAPPTAEKEMVRPLKIRLDDGTQPNRKGVRFTELADVVADIMAARPGFLADTEPDTEGSE